MLENEQVKLDNMFKFSLMQDIVRVCASQFDLLGFSTLASSDGATVDPIGQHALSSKKHPGRTQRHAWLNDLIHHVVIRAEIPAVKLPRVSAETTERDPMA